MKEVTPRMKALQEKYKDDKQRLNQAMMELYRTEKINPVGGCLPIMLQIPVFLALYWVLQARSNCAAPTGCSGFRTWRCPTPGSFCRP